ncbi:DUF5084 family protein [Staphylococcus sp. IVB6181]|uniref:DUF5084 family protein n=1 Tax=Staphylococcus sp. IVB6181 TaxID=2929481 RepID=UPI0021CEE7E6|nr:DUF5084 family protein [Staphylococcus sp. IVB6181]UXV34847.1 DUF5084 family protein [Staphylococcus sp. IVB6181]
MKHVWWILLVIGLVMNILSIDGFILSVGCLGVLIVGLIWPLFTFPSKTNIFSQVNNVFFYITVGMFYVFTMFMVLTTFITLHIGAEFGPIIYGTNIITLQYVFFVLGILAYTTGSILSIIKYHKWWNKGLTLN